MDLPTVRDGAAVPKWPFSQAEICDILPKEPAFLVAGEHIKR